MAMNYTEQFMAARKVSTPLVNIRTFDAASTRAGIKKLLTDDTSINMDKTPILQWDIMNGVRPANKAGQEMLQKFAVYAKLVDRNQQPTLTSTAVLEEMLRLAAKFGEVENHAGEDVILYIDNAHLYWAGSGSSAVIQGIWNLRDIFKKVGNMLVLLSAPGSTVPPELVNDVLILDEPLPTSEELDRIVSKVFTYAKFEGPDADVTRRATDALIGLPAFAADQSAAMCLVRDSEKTGHLDIDSLWSRKRAIINQTPGLQMWDGPDTLEDIGGLESVKRYLKAVMEGKNAPRIVIFMDEIEKGFAGWGTDTSGATTKQGGAFLTWSQNNNVRGMLGTGVPGAGKSKLAKGIHGTYGIPVVSLDIAAMQSSLVGSSEARTQQAFSMIDAVSSGNAYIIATSNSVQSLPPELLRRFQMKYFFEEPSTEEKAAIWPIYLAKYGFKANSKLPNDMGWTGAEIETCAATAYQLNISLTEAAQYIVPTTVSSRDSILKLKRESSGRYLSASHPGMYLYDMIGADAVTDGMVDMDTVGRKIR